MSRPLLLPIYNGGRAAVPTGGRRRRFTRSDAHTSGSPNKMMERAREHQTERVGEVLMLFPRRNNTTRAINTNFYYLFSNNDENRALSL